MMTSPPSGSIMTASPTVHATQPTLHTTPSLPGNVTAPQVTATSSAPTIATSTTVLEATTIATSPPEAKIKLGFKMEQNFISELGNKSSPQFKSLSDKVTTALDDVYTREYGIRFIKSVVSSFS
ncbi:uncharacterized protein LOC108896469 [Lates calcarifer]|uniref:Uncharacterized protein LOC108896469 n=1 Tax=Lates calcarifer TaxID=8187 RepID=A0AAJ8DPE6_LATCA|nr:uncharacterized protein LOC108896469 [Lates calcarifer]